MPFAKGRPKTGGRVKGTINRAKVERLRAEEEARVRLAAARLASEEEIEQAVARMHTMSPLEIMLMGMHLKLGRGDIDGAQKIAEAAAPYTAPRLNAAEVKIQHSLAGLHDDQVAAEIQALQQKLAIVRQGGIPLLEAAAEPQEIVQSDTDMTHPSPVGAFEESMG